MSMLTKDARVNESDFIVVNKEAVGPMKRLPRANPARKRAGRARARKRDRERNEKTKRARQSERRNLSLKRKGGHGYKSRVL